MDVSPGQVLALTSVVNLHFVNIGCLLKEVKNHVSLSWWATHCTERAVKVLDNTCCSLLCDGYVKNPFLSSVDVFWLKKCIHKLGPILLKQWSFYTVEISLTKLEPVWHLLLLGKNKTYTKMRSSRQLHMACLSRSCFINITDVERELQSTYSKCRCF